MKILQQVPHYHDAKSISTVDVEDLSAESFAREYVDRMRPCLIRGAARHWPALERWRSLDYLRDKIGNPTIRIATRPLVEPPSHPDNKGASQQVSLAAFVDELRSDARGHYVLHSCPLLGKSALAPLGDDVLGFPFLGEVKRPLIYPPRRAFLFRDSYTDWHYHQTDETLMTQVKESKEVLLLPPDKASFDLLSTIGAQTHRLWDVDATAFPGWAEIRPYRLVVTPGDALYIPTFWWHAVESTGEDFGWTVAWCWRTPLRLFDPRLAGVRSELKRQIRTRYAPLALLAATWSTLSLKRLGKPPFTI